MKKDVQNNKRMKSQKTKHQKKENRLSLRKFRKDYVKYNIQVIKVRFYKFYN